MSEKESRLMTTRIADRILSDLVLFEAMYANSPDPVPFDERLKLKYRPIREGSLWGQAWVSAWFHLKGRVPESWKGRKVVAHLDFSGEGYMVKHKRLSSILCSTY